MAFFYQHLMAQYPPAKFWHLMTAGVEQWTASVLDVMAKKTSFIAISPLAENVEALAKTADRAGRRLQCIPAHPSEHQQVQTAVDQRRDVLDFTSEPSAAEGLGLVLLGEPASNSLHLKTACEKIRPTMVIFRLPDPGSVREGAEVLQGWTSIFRELEALGYTVIDPSGDALTVGSTFRNSMAWLVLAFRDPLLASDFHTVTLDYRNAFDIDPALEVEERRFHCGNAEIVSLRTAALATNSEYLTRRSPNSIFDIYQRRTISDHSIVELARFETAYIIPHAGWKIFTGDRYYVEEIGPSAWEGLYRISHWRTLDGYFGLDLDAPVVKWDIIPRNAFLLGGDGAYYHWIFNFLPRLIALDLLDTRGLNGEPIPVLVGDYMPDRLLEIVPRLVRYPVRIVKVPTRVILSAEDLYVPSFYSGHEGCLDVAQFYRDRLDLPSHVGNKRIYISRRDARDSSVPRRKVHNEEEVIAFLSQFGFEPVELGSATSDEQIRLFSEAEFVIGPHGAAFANMVFSAPQTKAIIFENSWNHTFQKDVLIVNQIEAETLLCEDVIDETYEQQAIQRGEAANELQRSRDMIVDLGGLGDLVRLMLREA